MKPMPKAPPAVAVDPLANAADLLANVKKSAALLMTERNVAAARARRNELREALHAAIRRAADDDVRGGAAREAARREIQQLEPQIAASDGVIKNAKDKLAAARAEWSPNFYEQTSAVAEAATASVDDALQRLAASLQILRRLDFLAESNAVTGPRFMNKAMGKLNRLTF